MLGLAPVYADQTFYPCWSMSCSSIQCRICGVLYLYRGTVSCFHEKECSGLPPCKRPHLPFSSLNDTWSSHCGSRIEYSVFPVEICLGLGPLPEHWFYSCYSPDVWLYILSLRNTAKNLFHVWRYGQRLVTVGAWVSHPSRSQIFHFVHFWICGVMLFVLEYIQMLLPL